MLPPTYPASFPSVVPFDPVMPQRFPEVQPLLALCSRDHPKDRSVNWSTWAPASRFWRSGSAPNLCLSLRLCRRSRPISSISSLLEQRPACTPCASRSPCLASQVRCLCFPLVALAPPLFLASGRCPPVCLLRALRKSYLLLASRPSRQCLHDSPHLSGEVFHFDRLASLLHLQPGENFPDSRRRPSSGSLRLGEAAEFLRGFSLGLGPCCKGILWGLKSPRPRMQTCYQEEAFLARSPECLELLHSLSGRDRAG